MVYWSSKFILKFSFLKYLWICIAIWNVAKLLMFNNLLAIPVLQLNILAVALSYLDVINFSFSLICGGYLTLQITSQRYMYTYGWFMWRFDRKQNSVKQLSFNKKLIKNNSSVNDFSVQQFLKIYRLDFIFFIVKWHFPPRIY